MRLKVRNVKPGYCEVWANTHPGGRYQRLAVVMRDKASGGSGQVWHWSAKTGEPPFFMPFYTYAFDTRRACVVHCMRTALLAQAYRAIDEGKGLSKVHWHCSCRDALSDMWDSHLFSLTEYESMKKEMEVSGVRRDLWY